MKLYELGWIELEEVLNRFAFTRIACANRASPGQEHIRRDD